MAVATTLPGSAGSGLKSVPKVKSAGPTITPLNTNPIPGRVSTTRTNLNPGLNDNATPKKIASIAGAKAGSPPTPTAATATPAAQPTPTANGAGNPFQGIAPPGLNPDQTASFNTAWNNYQASVNSDNANLAQAPIDEAATVAKDKAAYVQNSETAQAGAASRGLFNSSIKDGAMNDIAATQANNDFLAAGQLASLTAGINADIARLNSNWGATATAAVGDAVINGQNVTPTVPAAAPTAPGAAQGTYGANQAYNQQVETQPTDWRPVWTQQQAASNPNPKNKAIATSLSKAGAGVNKSVGKK